MKRSLLIRQHYEDVWGGKMEACNFVRGPIHELPADFCILRLPPHGDRRMWTYATAGMSQAEDKVPIELHMFSPQEAEDVVELLVATAHFHRTATRLGLWHTVNFGRPWIGKSNCDHGLVSLPYLDGPVLEDLATDSCKAKFYWLIPITSAEVQYKAAHGIEALEECFERSNLNYVDPLRASAV